MGFDQPGLRGQDSYSFLAICATKGGVLTAFRQDLEGRLRKSVRQAIEMVLQIELTEALGSAQHEPSAAPVIAMEAWSGPSPRPKAFARCGCGWAEYAMTWGDEGIIRRRVKHRVTFFVRGASA